METKELRLGVMSELNQVRKIVSQYSDDILEYLAAAKIAERNKLDLTVDDLFCLREIHGRTLKRDKLSM